MDFRTRKKIKTMTNPFAEFHSMSTPEQPTLTDWSAVFKYQPEEPKPDPIGFRKKAIPNKIEVKSNTTNIRNVPVFAKHFSS